MPSNGASPKLLVLAMDAMESELVLRWAGEKQLPAFRALLSEGMWANIESPPGLSGAIWVSWYTGVNAARHGRYYYSQLIPGTYRTALFHPAQVAHEPFWNFLSRAGRRVAVIDVPKTCPLDNLNGIQLVDWANHDADILKGFRSWPPELCTEIDRRYGEDPFNRRHFGGPGPKNYQTFRDGLVANVEHKTQLLLDFLKQEPWDLFCAAFDDAHWAGHFCWHLHDPSHPLHDARLGNVMKDVYRALDRALGRILDMADEDTTIMVVSSHGMGPGYIASDLLDPILRRLEGAPTGRASIYRQLRWVWDGLPCRLQRSLMKPKDVVRDSLLLADKRRRRCFTVPINNDVGAIRINVKGREPAGLVQKGNEYEQYCDLLVSQLQEINNFETGEPIVSRIVKINEHFHGEHLDVLPDLIVEWNRSAPIRRFGSPRIGTMERKVSSIRTGEHTHQGLFIVKGPGIPAQQLPEAVSVLDVAPTICALLGVPLDGVDGTPIPALLQDR